MCGRPAPKASGKSARRPVRDRHHAVAAVYTCLEHGAGGTEAGAAATATSIGVRLIRSTSTSTVIAATTTATGNGRVVAAVAALPKTAGCGVARGPGGTTQ